MTFNGAQLHLLINHGPVIGFPLVLLAYAWGKVRREAQVSGFAVYLYLFIWSLTALAYFTGEGAEDTLKTIRGFDLSPLERHEDLALVSFVLSSGVAILALAQVPFISKSLIWLERPEVQKRIQLGFIIGLCVAVAMFAVVAHYGGLIRHTELL